MSANVIDCSYLSWKAFVYVYVGTGRGVVYRQPLSGFLFKSDRQISHMLINHGKHSQLTSVEDYWKQQRADAEHCAISQISHRLDCSKTPRFSRFDLHHSIQRCPLILPLLPFNA